MCIFLLMHIFNRIADFHSVAAELQMTTHLLVTTDIKFCKLNTFPKFSIFLYCSIYILHTWLIDVIVTLHTDTCDRYTCVLHLLNHVVYPIAFTRVGSIIVIIVKDSFWISFMSIFKSFSYKLITCNLVEKRLAVWVFSLIIICHSFVNNIPAIDNVPVTVDDSMDMFFHPFEKHLF